MLSHDGAYDFLLLQLPARLQHAAHLGERGGGVGDGAEAVGAHDAVEARLGRGQRLGRERHQFDREARLARAAQGERVHLDAGVHPHDVAHPAGVVVRQVQARADADLEHPAVGARHHPRTLAAHHPKTAGAVDQAGEQEAGVEGGGCGHGRCKAALNGVVCPDSSLRC